MLNRMLSWSTSQTTGIYDYAFRQVCATFGIEAFQEDQKMFFEDNNVSVLLPTAYGRSLVYQATPIIDLVSPREETDHYIYCTAS